jgi:hypothetical protein
VSTEQAERTLELDQAARNTNANSGEGNAMATVELAETNAGVINPFALVEIKLRRTVNWRLVADPKLFVEAVLGFEYVKLFDPQFGSPLYPGVRFDTKLKKLVRDESVLSVQELLGSFSTPDEAAKRAGAYRIPGNPLGIQWSDPGQFFTAPADFTDPVQGGIPDCHFISALASLAWARPYLIAQRTRPIAASDDFAQGSGVDEFDMWFPAGTLQRVEVTELLPLLQPGNQYLYARSSKAGETWPAVYEKAWVKLSTNDTGDEPDYSKIGGGDPMNDLAVLTGLTPSWVATQGQSGDSIWNDVRSHCEGSWTFDPMAACTYASAAAAPTPINYGTANLVAGHCYSILGWQYDEATQEKFIVLRNPWGFYEATLDVDPGPWVSIEQIPYFLQEKYGEGDFIRSLDLPVSGIFALGADTFQQYFQEYGWVS